MSHALYSTVLMWSVTRGFAKLHGVLAAIGEPLMLMGRRVAEIRKYALDKPNVKDDSRAIPEHEHGRTDLQPAALSGSRRSA